MKITALKLYTNRLAAQKEFYTKTLGIELADESPNHFTLKIGWSELTFERSEAAHKYHFCFLIPSNKLAEAMVWMAKKVEIVAVEKGRKTAFFETWNAESFYFFDAAGNIVEFIVRYDLKNERKGDFDVEQILCVNEIGMPIRGVAKANELFEKKLKTKFWKGNIERFGTNGTQEGLFLLPDYEFKKTWFPTSLEVKPEPLEAIVENDNRKFLVKYENEDIKIADLGE